MIPVTKVEGIGFLLFVIKAISILEGKHSKNVPSQEKYTEIYFASRIEFIIFKDHFTLKYFII